MALGAIAVVLLIVVEQKNSFKKSNSYVSRKIASIRNKALYVHEFGRLRTHLVGREGFSSPQSTNVGRVRRNDTWRG